MVEIIIPGIAYAVKYAFVLCYILIYWIYWNLFDLFIRVVKLTYCWSSSIERKTWCKNVCFIVWFIFLWL